ncbi:precorrin-2 dehydrogenase/sirohydrochlorin ferrochelatase [Staphylococcus hominis]|uniref:NAD(P)-binding protein n=1 Tax=Staphylococcus TaxID=1279 RepID=UPI0008A2A1E9|nr:MULTISPECIES: NAD(P)-binding protein [Staphylococcus]MBB4832154.1 precorrin-2 dehydrogenase/sirohydrochlorin ferrochelatase [Staphylococcus hominis]MCI2890444.1 NAD(P)-binding protein [Staphylococcus hominis]MDS3867105.1 NAD(P)-binding protein [Staphylococcus hominis]OFO42301.1 precorrin-2 dehydrogenase [Staphylococcus sp. HMSC070D05]TRL99595.1 NAD(P)-binding protein [Staphylococcus hominis]
MNNMPLMIDLSQKSIVIVGGGKVATKRASTLIEYCADVHIVSPIISTTLKELLDNENITWSQKEFEPQDVEHADFVVIATNNNEVNTKVLESVPPHALCNHASKAQVGNVTIPSILKRGKLSISVSTNGASPKLSKKMISRISDMYDESYEMYIDFLYESRQLIKRLSIEPSRKQDLLQHILSDEYLDEVKQQEFTRWLHLQV